MKKTFLAKRCAIFSCLLLLSGLTATAATVTNVIFADNFEAGLNQWTITAASPLNISPAGTNVVPSPGGQFSAEMASSLNRMHRNLNGEVNGPALATWWIYDPGATAPATRIFNEVRGYSGGSGLPNGGTTASGSLLQLLAAGKYNATTLPGDTFVGTKYQGRANFLSNTTSIVWFNLNGPGSPVRSTGWHRFDVERLADMTTINFYVDGILSRTVTGAVPETWDTLILGSGLGSTAGTAWIDGLRVALLTPALTLICPGNINTNAQAPTGVVVNFSATPSGGCTPSINVTCNPPSGSTFPIGTTTVICTASDSCNGSATCSFTVTVRQNKPGFFPNPVLPPPNGVYISPRLYHQLYANGIIIRDIKHRRFTGGQPPPPPGGAPQTHQFGSVVELEHSTDGGVTFQKVSAPANCSVRVTPSAIVAAAVGGESQYDTEMLQLDIAGGSLPAGVMLRESPTKASTGQTTVRQVGGGYMIDSFFDVFTEISLDGGANWSPAQDAARVELRPDVALVTPIPAATRLLPPPNDRYISPAQFHLLAAQGIVIKDVRHSFFTHSMLPPPAGKKQTHQFDSQVDMLLSQDNGQTFRPVRAPAAVAVEVEAVGSPDSGLYDTEMLALNIQGGGLPLGVMIRESPTEPSRGSVSIAAQADGTYRIGSFFDIFVEVSLDGGQNWAPAQSPARVELVCDAPEQKEPNPNLPPLDGQYISPQKYHALYAQGIIISNVSHKRFTQSQPPPPPGGTQTHQFNSEVEFDLIRPGQPTAHVLAPAAVNVRVTSTQDEGATRFFETEMLSLNISGGGLPSGVMVRESPTKQSLGRTSIRMVNDPATGIWDYISSFFDIFTELSLDGGASWNLAATGPSVVVLNPPHVNCIRVECQSSITNMAASSAGRVVNYPPPVVIVDFCNYTVDCVPPSGSLFPIGTTPVSCHVHSSTGDDVYCNFNITVTPQVAIMGPEHFFPYNFLPPTNGLYISPTTPRQRYGNGVIIKGARNHFFTQGFTPPAPGASETHSFRSQVDCEISFDGGNTFQLASAPALMTVQVTGVAAPGPENTFNTEMLQLDIAGGSLPPGVAIRESPTLQSTGQTTVRPVNGGYMIGSFFDVFTEISLDGGNTWSLSQDAAHTELRVDPATVAPATHPTSLLPPPEGAYVSPAQFHALYAQSIVIKDVKHSFFTQSLPPPTGSNSQTHTFGSQVDMMLSTDGGNTYRPIRAPATVRVRLDPLTAGGIPGGGCIYDTEMLSLDLAGGDLPAGLMLRESPSLPSLGGTMIVPNADGTQRIHSFFDIFTEVSLDGGQTWNPAQNGPVRMEEQKPAQPHVFPSPNLPPVDGQYISPAKWHALYANGITISNVSHDRFTQGLPPPPPGGSLNHNFGSQVHFDLYRPGQAVVRVTAPCAAQTRVTSMVDSGNTRYFDTEMLALNISGGGLPAGVMVRESPSKQSLGRTSLTPTSGGGFALDSFFDIFTELSLDNGATWSAAITPAGSVGLAPSPFAAFTINCPSNITTTATGPGGKVVTYVVTYLYPDCPFGPFTVTCNPPSGSVFPIGTTTVTCTGSDGCGEHPTCSFTVTVNPQVAGLPPAIFFLTNTLPPLNGVYISPARFHQLYASGIIIRDVRHRFFTQSMPPPPSGGSQTHTFGSQVEGEASTDGGLTFFLFRAPAQVTVRVDSTGVSGGTQTYATEMLQLNIAGGTLPPGAMLRESPTLQSLGQTTVRPVPGGFMISSFFDIKTEVSLDAGANWSPARDAAHVELRKDAAQVAPIPTPTNLLPPRNDFYVSPALFHQLYAQGIVIKDAKHRFFTQSQPPPPPGGSNTHTFNSYVDLTLSMNGGASFQPLRAVASVVVNVVSLGDDNLLDTEMLALNISGGDLPAGMMIRESPTLASRGGTLVENAPGGTFLVHSFFDIWTDLSLDGGQTWNPASNGPVHVELQCNAPEHPFPDPKLPPPTGQYVSPQRYHVLYANGIILSNASHKRFTESQPPPPPGGTQTHSFGSEVEFDLVRPGQPTLHLTAPASVQARVTSSQDEGTTRYFDTEMLLLNIQGGGLPSGVMVRESPTKQSLGRTSVRQMSGGAAGYEVSSFFDIFTELSLDAGQTWSPQVSAPAEMSLEPLSAGPCTGPARMQIALSGGTVTISWSGAGFRLQCTDRLESVPGNTVWIDVAGTSPVTVPFVPGKNRFYRVVCP